MIQTNLRRFAGITLLAAFLASAPAFAREDAAFNAKAVDALVSQEIEARGLVGISLAIARDGAIVLDKGYGKRSIADNAPASPDTMFAIGSVTKQFTCACLLLLAEDGKLSVMDKVAKYYPDLTRAGDITLLDLMNHVSGYPDYYPLDFVDLRMLKPIAVDEVIRMYGTGKLDFEPGTRYSYSNTGYDLLGRVVEKVSGEPFGAFLSRRILRPLGLTRTTYEPDTRGDGFARGYTSFALGSPEPAAPEAKSWVAAAGAIYSTAGDLARWDLALMSGKVLKPESYRLMTTPRTLSDGKSSGYGCGLSIGERSGKTVLSHNGAVAGFLAYNIMVPDSKTAVVLISNFDASGDAAALFRKVAIPLLPETAPAPAPAKKDSPAPLPGKGVPVIAGPPAPEQSRALFLEFQSGAVDRSKLSPDFNWFLTGAKIRGAAERLKAYGPPTAMALESINERGGMEVTSVRLRFGDKSLRSLMYRTPDGIIQQYFLYKD